MRTVSGIAGPLQIDRSNTFIDDVSAYTKRRGNAGTAVEEEQDRQNELTKQFRLGMKRCGPYMQLYIWFVLLIVSTSFQK
jgi:hypothetical protein